MVGRLVQPPQLRIQRIVGGGVEVKEEVGLGEVDVRLPAELRDRLRQVVAAAASGLALAALAPVAARAETMEQLVRRVTDGVAPTEGGVTLEQSTATNGASALRPWPWIARASISRPVPRSP